MAASPIALVRSTVLAPVVEFLDQERVPYEGLFVAAKLSPRLIERPNDLIPLAQGCALLEKIARATGLEDIGLLAASKIKIPAFGQYGDLVSDMATLCDALHSLIAGINAFSTGERLSLEWRNARLFLCHKLVMRPTPGKRYGDFYSMAVMVKTVQCALGSEWKPDLILLPRMNGSENASTRPSSERISRSRMMHGRSTFLLRGLPIPFARPSVRRHQTPRPLQSTCRPLQMTILSVLCVR